MDIDFLKELYKIEIERKHQLSISINIPIALLVVFGGVLAKIGLDFSYKYILVSCIFIIFYAFSIFFYLISIYCLIMSYYNARPYCYLTSPGILKQYYDDLCEYYVNNNEAESLEKTKIDFDALLLENYIQAIDTNLNNNDTKSRYINDAVLYIIITLITTFITSIPFVIDKVLMRQ